MGLDSYLYAKKFLSPLRRTFPGSTDIEDQFHRVVDEVGLADLIDKGCAPSAYVQVEVAYWRKANQIHNYFVSLGGGDDDCREIEVGLEDLEGLVELCKEALASRDASLEELAEGEALKYPEDILPTRSGFFFGSTDYDEGYYHDLENTLSMLEPILAHEDFKGNWNWGFVYRASW